MSFIRGFAAIAFTLLINAMGTLLWLSRSQGGNLQQRLVAEAKRMMPDHLQAM